MSTEEKMISSTEVWGETLREYFRLPEAGHMLATNLHADTYDQAHHQVCIDNGVPEAAFRRMNLMFFLSISRLAWRSPRRITEVWESDGLCEHRRVASSELETQAIESSRLVSDDQIRSAREAIDRVIASGARSIDQVRQAVLRL